LVNNFFLNHIKSRSSLPQVGCARGANTFPSHNQSLTRKSLIKTSTFRFPSNLESNTRWRLSNQANEFKLPSTPRGDVWQHWYMGRIYQWIHSLRFNESRKHLASFFPFILGPKIRVGQNLDTVEAKIVLAMLIKHYSFRVYPTYFHAPMLFIILQ
jgi:hypothetical protein